jgi:methylglutaconyl-CoA hydratase
MSDVLQIDDSNPAITILSMNRPEKRNALSIELIEQLTRAVDQANKDLNRRVIILRGEGPVFCAGLDLKEASDPNKAHGSAVGLCEMYKAICESPLITIAQAQGAAMGGGAGLIAACDFAVVSDDLRLAYPEVHRGLVAALVTTLLRRQVNDRQARELVLLGQSVDAANALEMGLVNRVVPLSRLSEASMSLAQESCKGAPGAIARSKKLLDNLSARPISLELNRSIEYHLAARNSADAREGAAAFFEKRPPRWGPRTADDAEEYPKEPQE